MSVGPFELLFLVLVTLFALTAVAVTKGRWRWLVGIPICVAIPVLVTPADLRSTFLVATPYTLGYAYLMLKRDEKNVKKSD